MKSRVLLKQAEKGLQVLPIQDAGSAVQQLGLTGLGLLLGRGEDRRAAWSSWVRAVTALPLPAVSTAAERCHSSSPHNPLLTG